MLMSLGELLQLDITVSGGGIPAFQGGENVKAILVLFYF
jgi:hypothetical protein